MLGDLLK